MPGKYSIAATEVEDALARFEIEQFRDDNIPLRRFGEVTEVGGAVAVLLSNKVSGYTTGADVTIDGGLQYRPVKLMNDAEIRALNESEPQLKK